MSANGHGSHAKARSRNLGSASSSHTPPPPQLEHQAPFLYLLESFQICLPLSVPRAPPCLETALVSGFCSFLLTPFCPQPSRSQLECPLECPLTLPPPSASGLPGPSTFGREASSRQQPLATSPTSLLCWLHSLFTLCRDLIYLVSYLVDICSPAPPTGT